MLKQLWSRYKLLVVLGFGIMLGATRWFPPPAPVLHPREPSPIVEFYAGKYHISPALSELIVVKAAKHDIPRPMAFRLVWSESRFYPDAESPVGAIGLAQVLPTTALMVDSGAYRERLFDPEVNLEVGFAYLSYLRRRYHGKWSRALYAYNVGPRAADALLNPYGWPYVHYILTGK